MSVEVVICPLCRVEIHRHIGGEVITRARVPSRSGQGAAVLAQMLLDAIAEQDAERAAAERDCTEHYQARHRVRLWSWRRLGWTWLMRWPTRKQPEFPAFGQIAFDPVRFIK